MSQVGRRAAADYASAVYRPADPDGNEDAIRQHVALRLEVTNYGVLARLSL